MNRITILLVTVVTMIMMTTACKKDDDANNPNTSVPDPAGTITSNISENTYINFYETEQHYIGRLLWAKPDNFYLEGGNNFYISICNMGRMNGLGNITHIPTSGFSAPTYNSSKEIACEAGHGYVIKIEKPTFAKTYYARLYVVEPIVSTTGGIMGAKVKYQYPFENVGEMPLDKNLSNATPFTWQKIGTSKGSGLDAFGLEWTSNNTTYAQIVKGTATKLVSLGSHAWTAITTQAALKTAINYSSDMVLYAGVTLIDTNSLYDDVLGVVNNETYYMIHITNGKVASEGSINIEITGEYKK